MKAELPEVGFKGNRDYVQGPDIYNAAIELLAGWEYTKPQNIDFRLHKLVHSQMTAELHDRAENAITTVPHAVMTFMDQEKQLQLLLVENGREIGLRTDYPENEITNYSLVSEHAQSIELLNNTEFTSIEVLIALNKHMLNRLLPEASGKWLFVRLTIKEPLRPAKGSNFKLKLNQFVGGRLTKSTFSIDNNQTGTIFFSLV